MNYWKKIAFGLALVAGLCGGAWAQDWGHRDRNHDRDDHHWRDRGHNRDHDRDRDRNWRYRNNPNYQYRNGQWGWGSNRTWGGYYPNGNYGYYPNGTYYPYPNTQPWGYYPNSTWGYGPGNYGYSGNDYQIGYRDGLAIGRRDRGTGRGYINPGNYKQYKYGDQAYRNGFWAGYRAAFGVGW